MMEKDMLPISLNLLKQFLSKKNIEISHIKEEDWVEIIHDGFCKYFIIGEDKNVNICGKYIKSGGNNSLCCLHDIEKIKHRNKIKNSNRRKKMKKILLTPDTSDNENTPIDNIPNTENNYFHEKQNVEKTYNNFNSCYYCGNNCAYPSYMLGHIIFDNKYYKVCNSKKISLHNKLIDEKNNNKKQDELELLDYEHDINIYDKILPEKQKNKLKKDKCVILNYNSNNLLKNKIKINNLGNTSNDNNIIEDYIEHDSDYYETDNDSDSSTESIYYRNIRDGDDTFRPYYIYYQYVHKYTDWILNEICELKNIENNIDRDISIDNILSSWEYMCCIPEEYLIHTTHDRDIEEDEIFKEYKKDYLKTFSEIKNRSN